MYLKILYYLFLGSWLVPHPAYSQAPSYNSSVHMQVLYPPAVVFINGKRTVYYELHLVNFAKDSIELNSLSVAGTADTIKRFQLNGNNLLGHFARIGYSRKENAAVLPPGAAGVFFLEFALPAGIASAVLLHQLELTLIKGHQKIQQVIKGAITTIADKAPLVIGPALKGGPWAAIYDPSWIMGHRRVFYTVDGSARLPGRFAIDFIKLDSLGKLATGDSDRISNWWGYGSEVLAVADGIIASTRTDMAESTTLSAFQPVAPENATGNYVSLKINDNQFVFYEHLQPGSIKVKPGQQVKKGQVIAKLGFTGQTTGPHLHLHLANANAALGAEGIPFEFAYYPIGTYNDFGNFGKAPWTMVANESPLQIVTGRPAPCMVITFKE